MENEGGGLVVVVDAGAVLVVVVGAVSVCCGAGDDSLEVCITSVFATSFVTVGFFVSRERLE